MRSRMPACERLMLASRHSIHHPGWDRTGRVAPHYAGTAALRQPPGVPPGRAGRPVSPGGPVRARCRQPAHRAARGDGTPGPCMWSLGAPSDVVGGRPSRPGPPTSPPRPLTSFGSRRSPSSHRTGRHARRVSRPGPWSSGSPRQFRSPASPPGTSTWTNTARAFTTRASRSTVPSPYVRTWWTAGLRLPPRRTWASRRRAWMCGELGDCIRWTPLSRPASVFEILETMPECIPGEAPRSGPGEFSAR
jgi:hypothetical protein